jgi:hypothetical protein
MGKRLLAYLLRALAIAATAAALAFVAGCTPASALLMGILPDGSFSRLLVHLEGQDDESKKRILEMEARKDWNGILKVADQVLAQNRNHADWHYVAGYAATQANRHGRAV